MYLDLHIFYIFTFDRTVYGNDRNEKDEVAVKKVICQSLLYEGIMIIVLKYKHFY